MPNTIAHFAVNGLISRAIIRDADLKWIYLACLIPDFPWIIQRLIKALPLSLDLYDLHAYSIVQSSFLLCIILCIALAALAKQHTKIFFILMLGCLLHLLLDALQIKWANGVQLLAPFDWQLFRLDLFWPESMGTYLLTAAGIMYLLFNLKKMTILNCDEFILSKKALSFCTVFVLLWLSLPFVFMQSVYDKDNHFIATLKDTQNRMGKYIELDRNTFVHAYAGNAVLTSYGEVIAIANVHSVNHMAKISIQGKFTDNVSIYVNNYHVHTKFRDIASIIGIACVLLIWLIFTVRCLNSKYRLTN